MKKYVPLAVWSILMFIGSSVPSAHISQNTVVDFVAHKSVHIFEYAVLFTLSYKAFNKNALIAFLYVLIYASTDELHQTLIPGRTGRVRDVFVDVIGGGMGYLIIWKFIQRVPPKLRNFLQS